MNDESAQPFAPPSGVKTDGNPPHVLIGIGAVVLTVLSIMIPGRSYSAPRAGGNPILGTWALVDTNMAAVCKAERVFRTYEDAKGRHEVPAIYVVQPTYVEVGYGGPNIEEWELHGPDDITLRMISPASVGYSGSPGGLAQTNCRYHRK